MWRAWASASSFRHIREAIHSSRSRSDHVNFERAGVPVVFLFRPDDPEFDTPRDTVDRVDPRLLEVSGRLATAIILAIAGDGR
ncbi:MAG: Zn-dependent exopeptidase M28 [Bacillati bacterium ANGP1]|uniref:Zn-dependent exopeptidase M28 n=1 Tax=Candidatus Segetimicrobium genomatis TaxID=2569760 RepID=A0A537LZ22_9BACT|nr:MAG: Zn-dependent exopeptidase M28 [Terrabacteria group bacterium ANGP1]